MAGATNLRPSSEQKNRTIEDELLTARNISITFPGVKALDKVDFTLRPGEIHALLGENGAGKSTLIKVLTGVYEKDSGTITLEGNTILPKSTMQAQELGISTVYQEINLCPNLSVAENIYIGRQPKSGFISWKIINQMAVKALEKLDLHIDVTQKLSTFSIAVQQMVAIARAIDMSAKIFIFDEPTSSLDEKEAEKLFAVMRALKEQGIGIVFVTHFLDQVYKVSDQITILRNGCLVGQYATPELSKVELVGKMIGKEYDQLSQKLNTASITGKKETYIQTKQLSRDGFINSLDMEVKKGEVLGLAGLLGSGRSETLRILFGVDKKTEGQILADGKRIDIQKVLDAMKNNFALCPEDRKSEGIIGDLSIRDNIILALQVQKGMFKNLPYKEKEELADRYIRQLNIKTPHANQLVKNLSGGNQQKVILARWLATNPRLFMLDEPTRGIDVGTKADIQKLVVELAGKGMSVIFVSSEIDEMIRCCNRMVVLSDHNKIGELNGDQISEQAIMRMIAGGDAS